MSERPKIIAIRRALTCSALRATAVLGWVVITAVVGASPPAAAQSSSGPKIYISADLEGVTGVVTADQLGPGGFEYERFRRFMTEEVIAAIDGARAAGAGEILVSDSHGNGENLLIKMLPDDVRIVRSWPRPLMMVEGIDETFDGAIFIGYHAGTTNPDGVRAHTMSSATMTDLRIHDVSSAEAIWNAVVAGHFGVPVIMLSGDNAIAAEAQGILGDLETAVVKEALSFHSANTLTPQAGQRLIHAAAERAVRRIDDFHPYVVGTPLTVTVRFKAYQPSQILALLPMFERIDAHAIRYAAGDMVEAATILSFLRNYNPSIEP